MDTVKDFFSDLKDRISNPFISSFVISWLVTNYEVPIVLLFYKPIDLHKSKYESYLDVIEKNNNIKDYLWTPFIFSLIYTFLSPWIKSGIRIFNSWITTSTDEIVFKITKNKVVSIEKHSQLKLEYQTAIEKYEREISTMGTSKADYINLQKEYNDKIKNHEKEIQEQITQGDVLKDKLTNEYSLQIDFLIKSHHLQMKEVEIEKKNLEIEKKNLETEKITLEEKLNIHTNEIEKIERRYSDTIVLLREQIKKDEEEIQILRKNYYKRN